MLWRFDLALFALLLAFGSAPAARADDYRLKIGDTLELTIAGINLQRRLTVDVDGKVSVPLAGELVVKGSTVDEILAKLRATLPAKSYTIRGSEGRDNVTVIAAEEISLSIAEYTAVFLNGDVARPGAQTFRPGITIRQAISLAGGYDLLRFRVDNPTIGGIDLQDDYRNTWTELERATLRLALAAAELKKPAPPARTISLPNPLTAIARSEIVAAETAQFRGKAEAFQSQRAALQKNTPSDDENIRVLTSQKKTEEDSYKFDLEEAERVAGLFKMGTVPITRVGETRRLTLLSATRVLQVAAQLEAAQRQRLTTLKEIDKLEGDRRVEVLGIFQDADGNVRRLSSRLQAVWDKLLYMTAMRSQILGNGRGTPTLEIVRTDGKGVRKLSAEEDSTLEPGDVVEVRLHVDVEQLEARN